MHFGRRIELPSRLETLHDVHVEKRWCDLQPDISASDSYGPLLIEIRVSHAVDDRKRRKIESDGVRMVEIDLSNVTESDVLDTERFEYLVLKHEANRFWISHPGATEMWRESYAELQRLVQAENARIQHKRGRRSTEIRTAKISLRATDRTSSADPESFSYHARREAIFNRYPHHLTPAQREQMFKELRAIAQPGGPSVADQIPTLDQRAASTTASDPKQDSAIPLLEYSDT